MWFGGEVWRGKVGIRIMGGIKSIYEYKGKKRSLKYCFVGVWSV